MLEAGIHMPLMMSLAQLGSLHSHSSQAPGWSSLVLYPKIRLCSLYDEWGGKTLILEIE